MFLPNFLHFFIIYHSHNTKPLRDIPLNRFAGFGDAANVQPSDMVVVGWYLDLCPHTSVGVDYVQHGNLARVPPWMMGKVKRLSVCTQPNVVVVSAALAVLDLNPPLSG